MQMSMDTLVPAALRCDVLRHDVRLAVFRLSYQRFYRAAHSFFVDEARFYEVDFPVLNGISRTAIYDLQGRRLSHIAHRGIYIVDGVKTMQR